MACGCPIKGESPAKSCADGPLTATRVRTGAPQPQGMALHQRHATQIFDCISRTLEGQPGHSRLQAPMPDEEELDCAPHNRKTITWTPNVFLSSLGHDTGFSTSEGFNKEKVHQTGSKPSFCVRAVGEPSRPSPIEAPRKSEGPPIFCFLRGELSRVGNCTMLLALRSHCM